MFSTINEYEYIIFDCPPSLGIVNQNVMLCCNEAIIPASTTYLSMVGITSMINAIETINKRFEHNLQVTHIVPTLHDRRIRINREILLNIEETYGDKVTAPIRINARLAEAPRAGKSIFTYDKNSRGAKDYNLVVKEILKSEAQKEKPREPISLRVQRMMANVKAED